MPGRLMSDSVIRIVVHGRVQGVGYRSWTAHLAHRRNLRGWVRNRSNGTVEAVFVGSERDVAAMIAACRRGPPNARVERVDESVAEPHEWPADHATERFSVLATL